MKVDIGDTKMGNKKIKLSFVNDGKSFTVPHFTVKANEELLEDLVELEKKYGRNTEKYNKEINKHIVVRALQTVDDSITIDDINNMHPDDYITLFNMIWSGGRELSDEGKFLGKEEETDTKE